MPASLNPLYAAAVVQVADALGCDAALFAASAPPKPELGDVAVGCFPAAKLTRQSPPALARQVVAAFAPGDLLEAAEAAGPFVNFRARRASTYAHLFASALGGGPLIPTTTGAGKTICIDFSSPNISKHLAYHHIRSTVIGHALVGINRALGYRVVGINHLGDWGTTHGMLLAAHDRWGAAEPLTIDALNDNYVRFRAEIKAEAARGESGLEAMGRAWFKRLEDGDPTARALWQRFKDVSLAEYQQAYDLLGIEFDEVKGESEYEADMEGVIAMLADKGLTEVSEGALVVRVDDLEPNLPPLLLKKQDGATLYATRDLAAALYRWGAYQFDRSLYVVDRGQSVHFRQLFATLRKAGYEWAARCEHVPFGLVRVAGKKTGTREGNVVLLMDVFAEAQDGMRERLASTGSELGADAMAGVCREVGIGAIVFANLVAQREKDVDFALDDVLDLSGDAGPYVQYAHARCASIVRKANEPVSAAVDPARLRQPGEWALATKLLELPDHMRRAADGSEPHIVCRYLLDLCAAFSRFYTAGTQDASLRVLCDDGATRAARLALVGATQAALAAGLRALGMAAPDAM
jgi:arginyl-tRNA synthetase